MISPLKLGCLLLLIISVQTALTCASAQQPTKINPMSLSVMGKASDGITHLVWASDEVFYSGDWNGTITPWKVGRKTAGRAFKASTGFIRSLHLLEGDKKYLACTNQRVIIGRLPGGTVIAKLNEVPPNSAQFNMRAVPSSDQKTIAILTGDQKVLIFDAKSEKMIGQLTLPGTEKASAVTPLPQGGWLVAATGLRHFPAGSMTSDFTIGTLVGIDQITVSPDGKRVAALGLKDLRVGELRAGAELSLLSTFAELSEDLIWSPNSQRVAVARDNGVVEFFDPNTGKVAETLTLVKGQTACLAYSPDGRRLAVGSGHYLDMNMRPPRQMTGDNTVRLLGVAPTATQPSR